MSEKYITVATYNRSFEAQLAKNLLENEGIDSLVGGGFSSDVLFGSTTVEDQIVLQVREEDAQRAAGILAEVAAAKLDDNWEERAEAEADVWLCTICGEPISNRLSSCFSCQTPREGIRAGTPREATNQTAIQPEPTARPPRAESPKSEEIVSTPAPLAIPSAPLPPPSLPDEDREEVLPTAAGDDRARRAFLASLASCLLLCLLLPVAWFSHSLLASCLMFCLLPVAWFHLLRVVSVGGEMSAKGVRHLYAALLINGVIVLLMMAICLGVLRFS